GDMIQSMAWHCDDANALAGQVDLIAVGECPVDTVDGRVVRPENPALGGGLERQYPAGMGPVVTGQQTCAQLALGVAAEPAYHRSGVTRVDSRHLERGVICQQPDVIVLKGGKGNEGRHDRLAFRNRSCSYLIGGWRAQANPEAPWRFPNNPVPSVRKICSGSSVLPGSGSTALPDRCCSAVSGAWCSRNCRNVSVSIWCSMVCCRSCWMSSIRSCATIGAWICRSVRTACRWMRPVGPSLPTHWTWCCCTTVWTSVCRRAVCCAKPVRRCVPA